MAEKRAGEVNAILSKIYYNVDTGFGSIAKTLKEAQKVDPSIKRETVADFLSRQEVKQRKKRRVDNSFVPFGPREQFQVDLADFGRGSEPRYAFLAIDIFTKKLVVVPVRDKTSETCSVAFDKVLAEMGIPNYVYSDDGGEFQGAFERKLEQFLIEHIVSRSPASFVERAIRTLREGINVRLKALDLPKADWWKMVAPVVSQYNREVHTTTGVTPNEAAALEWDKNREKILEVREAIEGKAHSRRKYPMIAVGDRVKVLRKPGKYGEFKSDFEAWTKESFKVERIAYEAESPVFYLERRARPLRLHEILKVEALQKAPRKKVAGKQGPEQILGGRGDKKAGTVTRAVVPAPAEVASSSRGPAQYVLQMPPRRKLLGKQGPAGG